MTPKINWNPSKKDLRWFGVIILIGFGLIGLVFFHRGKVSVATSMWAISSAIAFLAIVLPPLSKPFYFLWMFVALVLGSVMSRVVMSVIFYFVLTPVSLFFRLMKRDSLNRHRPSAPVETYWAEHPKIEDKKYYDHLF